MRKDLAGAAVPERFSKACSLLERGARERVYSAGVLLAARGEEVLLHASTGEARASSLFDVASLTKPLVAALFFVLVQQGKVALDDEVARVLPLSFADPKAREIRFRHLLSHTSGLPAYRRFFEDLLEAQRKEPGRFFGTAQGFDRIVRAVCDLPLEYAPGTSWAYSDPGYILLGRAVELLAFSPLDRLLQRELAQPLGMMDTFYLPLAALSECEAGRLVSTGFSAVRGREKVGEVDDENAAAMGGVAGHAGVFSTARDLFFFAREILRARRGEGRVLTEASAAAMTRKVASPPGCPRTLGFDTPQGEASGGSQAGRRFSPETVGHLGYTGCSLWIDLAREATVVLLTNRVYFGRKDKEWRALRPLIHDAVMEPLEA